MDAGLLLVFNANGVAASSPGLRGTRYPGNGSQNDNQPQRGCGLTECGFGLSTMEAGTALRFTDPFVFGSQSRPPCLLFRGLKARPVPPSSLRIDQAYSPHSYRGTANPGRWPGLVESAPLVLQNRPTPRSPSSAINRKPPPYISFTHRPFSASSLRAADPPTFLACL